MAKKIPIMNIIPRKDKQNTVQIIAKSKKINFNNDQTGYSHLKVRPIQTMGTPYIEIYTENPELGIPSEEYLEKNYLDHLRVNSVKLDSEFVFNYPDVENLVEKLNQAKEKITVVTEKFDESKNENNKLEKVVRDYDEFVNQVSLENDVLQKELNESGKENLELKTTTYNHNKTVNNSNYSKNGFFGYMSNVADKLDKFESENLDYNKFLSENRTLDRFLDEARSIGMIGENDGAEELLNYLSDYDLESEEEIENKLINSPLYKEKNNEKIKEYNQAKNNKEACENQITDLKNNDDLLESIVDKLLTPLNKEVELFNDIIRDYESKREKFIGEYSNKIEEYSRSLEDDAEKINLTKAVENAGSVIPFMIKVTENKDDYTFNFYLPSKKEKSSLCNKILADTIFNENIIIRKNRKIGREPLNINDLKEIKFGFVPGHDIRFGSMELSKEFYDEKRISEILETIQGDLKQGYENTGFKHIGFKMKASFEREFNGHYESPKNIGDVIIGDMQKGKGEEGYTLNDLRHILNNHFEELVPDSELKNALNELIPDCETQFTEIFITHLEKLGIEKGKYSSEEIIERIQSSNPEITDEKIKKGLNLLTRGLEITKDTIYTEGKGKGTRYFLN